MAKCKKMGKTEVYPFYDLKDMLNMMDYFKMKKLWHWYLVFNLGLLLGRRVSDTVSFKWSDFYYENGRMKDETDIKEKKTGKIARIHICGACKDVIKEYVDVIGINPSEHLNEFIINNAAKAELINNQSMYTPEEFYSKMDRIIDSDCAAYRKQFKIAADACNIQYPVSTHSTRKSFGYWSTKIHPHDLTTVDKLQGIFGHSSREMTLNYIGISHEDHVKLYKDMGEFISDVKNGKKYVIKNSPVIPIRSDDFRKILNTCWEMASNREDKTDSLMKLIEMAESAMV